MAITIGDALLKLGVDTKDLDKGMKGIGANIKKHQKAIGLGMAAAGGAILAAGALSIKTFAKMGDEVQKMALKTGFSTEALSELRHAAEISGATLGTLEKGVKKMAVSISDAKDGLATYTREFDKIGVSVEDLEGLSPEEQFFKLAEAIAAIEDPIQRAASAQKILGRAGTDLLPLFAAGKEGMAKLRQEAHKLGIVFDQEAANKAAEFTDAMHRMKESTSGVKMAIASELIPVLIPLITKITTIIKQLVAWIKEHPRLTKFIVLATTALGFLLVSLGGLLILLPGITAATAAFGITLSAAIWPITLIVAAIAGLIAIGVLLWKNWDWIKAKAISVWTSLERFFGEVWRNIMDIFRENWDKILAILFPAVGLPVLIARNWGAITEIVSGIWESALDAVKAAWKSAVDFVSGSVKWLMDKIRGVLDIINAIPAVNIGGGESPGGSKAVASWAHGGLITEPTLLTRVGASSPYGIMAERGAERIVPGAGGSQMMTVIWELDGRQIARTIMPYAVGEIRLKTGAKI